MPKVECICEVCGDSFYLYPSQTKGGQGRFCSRECKGRQMSEALRGPNNPRWRGGRYKTSEKGYVHVLAPGHANADHKGYVLEHRLVMSEELGRPLGDHEIVHHKNGVPDDNRLENLELMSRADHASLHHKGLKKPASLENLEQMTSEKAKRIWKTSRADERATHTCDYCGEEFHGQRKPQWDHTFCSRDCYFAFRRSRS